jgi:hypothetical protein
MHLTDSEFKVFETHFHCTSWPDEQYRIPIEVENPDGRSTWTAYLDGAELSDGLKWLDWHRRKLMAIK